MIDSSYLDCVIASKVHNAFRRNENNNHVLYVPKGKSYDDVLVVNEIGEQILQLAKNECTVREVIEQIHNDNPEIAYTKVEEDTYRFLQSAVGVNIIRIKGIENMYNGEVIVKENEYSIYRCKEGDFKTVLSVIGETGSVLEMTDPLVSSGMYNGVSVRARMFNFAEEFYLLKKKDKVCGLIGIINGKIYINEKSFIGKFILRENASEEIEQLFIKICVEHYKKNVNKKVDKFRIRVVKQDNDHIDTFVKIIQNLGFEQTGFFKNDFKGKDVVIYDSLLEKLN